MGGEYVTRRRSTSTTSPLLLGRGRLSALLWAGRGWWVARVSYFLHSPYTQPRVLGTALVPSPGGVLSPQLITHGQSSWPGGCLWWWEILPLASKAKATEKKCKKRKRAVFIQESIPLFDCTSPPSFFFFPNVISSFRLMSLWKLGFTTAFRRLYFLHRFPRTKSQGNQDSYIIKRSGAFLLR